MQVSDEVISGILARIQKLESQPPAKATTTVSGGETWHFFPEKIPLVATSPTAVTDWADSGSQKYIPADATRAIICASIEDTDGGVGRTLAEARGAGSILPIASLYETVDTAESSWSGQIHIPIKGGRFDWRLAELAAGASSTFVRIELVGYVK